MADERAEYRSWGATVKASGGAVTAFPTGPSKGAPAARYPMAVVAQLQAAKRVGAPGAVSADKAYGYYLAPPNIVKAAGVLAQATPDEIRAGADKLMASWDPFNLSGRIRKYALIAAGLGIVGAGLYFLAPGLIARTVRRRVRGGE